MIEGLASLKLSPRTLPASSLEQIQINLGYLITNRTGDTSPASITPAARQALHSDHELLASTTTAAKAPNSTQPKEYLTQQMPQMGL